MNTRQRSRFVRSSTGGVALGGIALGATALVIAATLTAGSAVALGYQLTDAGRPGHLVLRSVPSVSEWTGLSAGDSVYWLIDATLEDTGRSTLALELDATGALVDAGDMTVSVHVCDSPFASPGALHDGGSAAPVCPGGVTTILEQSSLADAPLAAGGRVHPLATLHQHDPRHVMVTLGLAPSADAAAYAATSARFAVGMHAAGDEPAPGASLATTGTGTDLAAFVLGAAGLILLGAGIRVWHRGRKRLDNTKP